MDILKLIGRELFTEDIQKHESQLCGIESNSSFLVIGGVGSIGQAVTKEIFKRNPKKLHIIGVSENNLVELVKDLRTPYEMHVLKDYIVSLMYNDSDIFSKTFHN